MKFEIHIRTENTSLWIEESENWADAANIVALLGANNPDGTPVLYKSNGKDYVFDNIFIDKLEENRLAVKLIVIPLSEYKIKPSPNIEDVFKKLQGQSNDDGGIIH